MQVPPLTHHDIIRHAAPLTHAGQRVNLTASDRNQRYIEFEPQAIDAPNSWQVYSLQVGAGSATLVTRVVYYDDGPVSVLNTIVSDVANAIAVFDKVSLDRQLSVHDDHIIARSYSLIDASSVDETAGALQLRFICAHVAGLDLRVDTSASSAMPADVRLLLLGKAAPYVRETLADGSDSPLLHRSAQRSRNSHKAPKQENGQPALSRQDLESKFSDEQLSSKNDKRQTFAHTSIKNLPDDLLAVLGPQWRPLVDQGDHWKGVLRLLGSGSKRTRRAESWVQSAVLHLSATLSQPARQYHLTHQQARWRVYMRRLQPLMLFVGILALMPISWLLVSEGGVRMHPLALALTPLLMVGVIVLTAREIPVMEIPPRPASLNETFWKESATGEAPVR
ncbi:MAG: hypothetical protein KTR32_21855 [Granulosicoccus sp.]|nr:hypothetical protein [Granulosicoccus sp.]